MKKILHLVYSGVGGSSEIVFSLINNEFNKKYKQQIIFSGPYLLNYFKIFCKKKKIVFFYKNFFFFNEIISNFLFILKILFKNKPDIILLHDFNFLPCLVFKLIKPKTKIIFINHTTLSSNNSWKIKIIIYFLFILNAAVFVNRFDFLFIKKKLIFFSKKIFLIENGIDVDFFSNYVKKKKKTFKIGIACRIDASRPYRLIAQSLLHPLIKNFNIHFSICGEGNDLIKFRKFIKLKKLTKKVSFEGFLCSNKLKEWFNSLDLYVQASLGEGMSTSVLQAMSMKVPVIGSNVSGLKNFLNNKKKIGMLFKNNVEDLAKAILFFYTTTKTKRKKFIDTQHKEIINKYNCKLMQKKYFFLIKNL